MASKDQLIFEVKIVPDEAGLRNLSSRVSREVGSSSNLKKQIDETADEVRLLTKDLENLGARGERSAEELEQAYAELQARLNSLDGVTKKTVSAQSTLIGAQNRLAGSTGNYNKLQSNANQALFSFGDIANDAQQFSFGFGQGLRAIGNNIGFLSEQVSNLSTKAGGLRGGLKALGSSLLGPGGIILGIQVVVSLLTVFGDKLFGAKNKAEDLNDSLKSMSSFFTQLAETGVEGFLESSEKLDDKIDLIDKALVRITETANDIDFGEFIMPLNEAQADATNIAGQFDSLPAALQKVNNQLTDADILERGALESVREVLKNKRAELEAQKLINEVLRETNIQRRISSESIEELPMIEIPLELPVDEALQEALKKLDSEGIENRTRRALAESNALFKIQLTQAEGFEKTRLQLSRERIQNENDLIEAGLDPKKAAELSYTLFYAKQAEARNEISRKEQQERVQNAQMAFDQIISLSSNYVSALAQLNQSRSDETEEQAKKRFDTQKRLSVVQAIIDGLAAAVGSYKVGARIGGPPLGAAFAAASTLATGTLIKAIQRQTYESGSFSAQSSSSSSPDRGFFTTENNTQTIPRLPEKETPINIFLEGEFDDEVVSVKARMGDNKRKRSTFFNG